MLCQQFKDGIRRAWTCFVVKQFFQKLIYRAVLLHYISVSSRIFLHRNKIRRKKSSSGDSTYSGLFLLHNTNSSTGNSLNQGTWKKIQMFFNLFFIFHVNCCNSVDLTQFSGREDALAQEIQVTHRQVNHGLPIVCG